MRLEISFQRADACRRRDKVSCIDFAYDSWDMPVPRVGERIFHNGLDELEDDDSDSEWRVTDVWWEPDADGYDDNICCEPQPHCVVIAELVGVEPDSDEDVRAYAALLHSKYADVQSSEERKTNG